MTRTAFEDELATRLRSLADQASIEPGPRPIEPSSRPRRAPTPQRSRQLVLACIAAFVVLVGAVAVAAVRAGDHDQAPVTTTPVDPAADQSWQALPEDPGLGTVSNSAVWTGAALIVWGGETDSEGTTTDRGAAFDPATQTWTELPTGPLEPRSGHAAVWTGTEMFVCCGQARTSEPSAAAYDPGSGVWRSLALAPIDAVYGQAVWTGTEVLVVGGADNHQAAAYDPSSDTWRLLPDPPGLIERYPDVAWTGTQLVVWPRSVFTDAPGMVYDPVTNTWTTLPPLPDDLAIDGASMVWTGQEILLWGPKTNGNTLIGARMSLADRTWQAIAETPLPSFTPYDGTQGSTSAVWNGTEMIALAGGVGRPLDSPATPTLGYDPVSDTWRTAAANHPRYAGMRLIWTGDSTISTGPTVEQLR